MALRMERYPATMGLFWEQGPQPEPGRTPHQSPEWAFVPRFHWPPWAAPFVRQPFPSMFTEKAPFYARQEHEFLHIADKPVNRANAGCANAGGCTT